MVLDESGVAALSGKKRSLITLDMPVPKLVVEGVSSSATDSTSRQRNYVLKRREYEQRGIPKYWVIDPVAAAVLIFKLVSQTYQEQQFAGEERRLLPSFPNLNLSAAQGLKAGL